MRNLLDLITLYETTEPTVDELEAMKSVIASKIKQLPDDAVTAKTLREIEDLLSHLGAGGRSGVISKELDSIKDPTVTAAQKMLSRYILSLDMTPDQRTQLFTLWREDKLVDRKKLLTIGRKTLADIISNYNENPAIKELVDDLMSISALGQGKGEFALSVLSKNIAKPQKGDLVVDGTKVEVKTTDSGAGRFTDQEVRPGAGFEQAARELAKYLAPYQTEMPKSGPNLDDVVRYYSLAKSDPEQKQQAAEMLKLIDKCISLIFEGQDVKPIIDAIENNNINLAKQEYAKTSFNYYMDKKEDDGVLYINLTKDPITLVWFVNADDLTASGMRLHAKTIYITSVADVRLPYPQMEIVDTKGATDTTKATGGSAEFNTQQAEFDQKIQDIAQRKPISDLRPTRTPTTPREKR